MKCAFVCACVCVFFRFQRTFVPNERIHELKRLTTQPLLPLYLRFYPFFRILSIIFAISFFIILDVSLPQHSFYQTEIFFSFGLHTLVFDKFQAFQTKRIHKYGQMISSLLLTQLLITSFLWIFHTSLRQQESFRNEHSFMDYIDKSLKIVFFSSSKQEICIFLYLTYVIRELRIFVNKSQLILSIANLFMQRFFLLLLEICMYITGIAQFCRFVHPFATIFNIRNSILGPIITAPQPTLQLQSN